MDRASTTAAVREPRLLVVGELCVDLIIELDGQVRFGQHEQLVTSTTLTLGSSSAITACGAATLGLPTSLVGVRGDDDFGRFIDEQLAQRGVDISAVRVDPSLPTGASTHLTRPDGDRAILTSMGSIGAVSAADVPDGLLSEYTHLHVGSYFLQEALWADAPALFARARSLGLTTSLDGNFDPSEGWDRGILGLLPHVDVFFGNEQELCGITGLPTTDAAVERLLDIMPASAIVVCKQGADGMVAVQRSGRSLVRVAATTPSLLDPLVDTVGAGDSLAAGFIAARLRGDPIEAAVALAVSCGTASTRGAGGTGAQPNLATAQALASTVPVTRSES
ncbi:carbohydrate kinase family protein [Diaminobutyricibacter sp. McL0618]|uniref:carbohydrate kinase family protein n=1 Tax=Leifsonia sp. McL0618 TaxID=3415677 RepID=UPI003CFB544A